MGIEIVTPERQNREMERGRNWECSWINALCYDRQQRPSGVRRGHGCAVSNPLAPSQSSTRWPSPAPSLTRSLAGVRWGGSSLAQRGSHVPGVRQGVSGQGRPAQCHLRPVHVLSPRGCFPGSWVWLGLVDPVLWDAWSKLLFDNSGDTVTDPRSAELPTPSARSLREEVLFRQADMGAVEPAQAGGPQAPLCPQIAPQHPLLRGRGRSLRSWRGSVVPGGRCGMMLEHCALSTRQGSWHWRAVPERFWLWVLLGHPCDGDPDLLPGERSRRWCVWTGFGGLKSLPAPSFLPPREARVQDGQAFVQPPAPQARQRLETLSWRLMGAGAL